MPRQTSKARTEAAPETPETPEAEADTGKAVVSTLGADETNTGGDGPTKVTMPSGRIRVSY